MQVLAIGNQKGGTSKTTTAAALGVLLSRQGERVHLIDVDPQASLSAAFGQTDPSGLLHDAMRGRTGLPVVRLSDRLTLTPSSIDLARGESQFMGEPGREFMLKMALEKTELRDDTLVILDCPPSLGVLALNCLAAADKLLVVVQPGGFELRALAHLQETIQVLNERINPVLKIVGAVLTNVHTRRAITEHVRAELRRLYPVLGLVRTDAKLLYATTSGTLLELRSSNALDDYAHVAERLQATAGWKERSAA